MSKPANEGLTATRDRVVTLHCESRDDGGTVVETTRGGQPLVVLMGHRMLLRGLERALEGRAAGEQVEVTLPPEQAYGPRTEDQIKRLSKKYFPEPARLRPGQVTRVRTEQGLRAVTVVKVGGKVVDVDLNHPYAGKTLHFVLEVVEVRAATPEETAHGHVHGPGGHAH
jgi:FKBP-type peptidyl-prolyl cis-trans isomerase SlyD